MINKTWLNWIDTERNLHLWDVVSSAYFLSGRDEGGCDPWPSLPFTPFPPSPSRKKITTSHSKSSPLFRTQDTVVVKVPLGALSKSQSLRALFTDPWRIVLVCPTTSLEGPGSETNPLQGSTKKQNEVAKGQRNFRNRKTAKAAKTAGVHNFSQSHWSSFSEQSALWTNLIMKKETRILAQTPTQFYPQEGWGGNVGENYRHRHS